MKVDSIDQYLKTLHQFHQEIENEPTNLSVTEKISQFLDDNREYLKENIEVATELNSIAVIIKNSSIDNPLIKKIRACVKKALPDEAQSKNQSLDMLRSDEKGEGQIAEWIDLAALPGYEQPLRAKELFQILGNKLNDPFIAPVLDGESLGKITEQLLQLKKEWNSTEKKIVLSLVKYCLQQDTRKITENIHKFGIQDQDTLVEIAKLCAQRDGWGVAANIEKFGIKNESVLIDLAKLCALQHAAGVARFIRNFGINDPDTLLEFAKLCAQHSGLGTSMYIKNFGIEDEPTLVEIAKLCAKECGWGTAGNIQKFGIQNKGILIELAKLCAQGGGAAKSIKNFGIEDEPTLIEIAKLCAKHDGWDTACHIQSLGIQNQADLVEIAMLSAQQNGERTAYFIKNFNIQDKKDLLKIFIECVIQSEAALDCAENFAPLAELFEASSKTIQWRESSEAHQFELKTLRNQISELDPFQQRIQTLWFLRCLALMTTLDQSALAWTLETRLLKDLRELRDPNLRQQLTGGLFALAQSAEGRNRWNQYVSEMTPEKGVRLLAIPLFALEKAGVSSEMIDQALNKALRPKIKKDARKIQRLLQITYHLASTPILKQEQKASAFRKIFMDAENAAEIQENAKAAIGLLQLKDTDWPEANHNLREIFCACFEKTIPLEGFKGDASQMYDKFFANSRHPAGLITYAAALKTLNEPELLECLGRFVVSVFDGTFKSQRYDAEQNRHLAEIYKSRPDLKEKWSQCSGMQFQNVFKDESLQGEVFDTKDWLTSKVCRFGHLGEEDVSIVRAYLDANSDESRDAVKKSLSEEIRKCSVGKKKADLDQDPKMLNLKIQLSCINLARAGNKSPLGALEKEFKVIKQSLEVKNVRAEFVNDVKAILETIARPKASREETFQAVITDDPLDLLYVGMDVQDSCQRLDGTPDLNKGLLGYLMDGKNQVLALKDPSGKIVARAMLRLMWDGQKPVLFREMFYPSTISQQEKEAMNNMAIHLAQSLGVAVTAQEGELEYGKPLDSLGGPAPWEYTDAGGGLQSYGIYSINGAKLLET